MKTRSYLYIIGAAALWGLIGLFVKTIAAQGFSSMQIVALRSVASATCITLVLLWRGLGQLRIALRDIWMFVGTGIFSLVFFNFCYFNCIQSSSLAVAALLLYTAPAFVMLMSLVLFGEGFTAKKGLALICTFIGCGCVTGAFEGGLSLTLSGLLYGLGSGFGYALYSIFGRYALDHYGSMTVTVWTFLFAGPASLVLLRPSELVGAFSTPGTWLTAAGLVVFSTVLPYILYTRGLSQVESGKASIMASLEPVVASLAGVLVFDEPMSWFTLAGIVCVLAGVYILR